MTTSRLLMQFLLCLLLLTILPMTGQPGPTPTDESIDHTLPESLDALYPPKAKGPLWLRAMLEMSTSFSGMVDDFLEGDHANAQQGYADFRRKYVELSRLVPEWSGDFSEEPMLVLGTALESRDPATFMPAVDRAAGVCHACHVRSMAAVQQKYHWGDFGRIALTDPVSTQDVPFTVFMRMLDGDLAGAQVDLQQGQVDQARRHAEGLARRFETLKDACDACHDSERAYYVDARITDMIANLGTALSHDPADLATAQQLAQRIGDESCHRCHLVHGPAALAAYATGSRH